MITLKAGDMAPKFEANDQDGNTVRLTDLKGKKVVLYFYPKDQTPGCIAESCNLRDNYLQLQKQGFEVFGISQDSEKSHRNFISKQDLPFSLLSDPDHTVHNLYGTWDLKKFMGKEYMGTLRATFVINENGKLSDVITKVKTKEHTGQILT
jgi:peroxiredoxin Q/BCP